MTSNADVLAIDHSRQRSTFSTCRECERLGDHSGNVSWLIRNVTGIGSTR
jgi:hypothetical protein